MYKNKLSTEINDMNKDQEKQLLQAICELNAEMDFPTVRIVDGNINEAVIRQATSYIRNLKARSNETSNLKTS